MARPKKVVTPPRTYTADEVWGAAVAAQRINGSYLKVADYGDYAGYGPNRMRNRDLMSNIMRDGTQTAEDIEKGRDVRTYFQGLLLKQLAGKVNSFEQSALAYASEDEFISTDYLKFATIASLPASYERGLKRDEAREEMSYLLEKSQHFGVPGAKVNLDVKVLRCVYSLNYMTHFVTALSGDNVVFFAYREMLERDKELKISGRIKGHRDNGQTQLNRVKVLEAN